ncbi:L-leucine ABC transporter membrane protein /L-isoleucine ABC transporter membrane protein /L-valine ABC transporter membrane protein [Aeromonas sp. RU39B]|jgi:branched-chain amino acid transport system permease protein|uniref:high-affinity branched-chain amino acid ABC transporter permease LivM n=1 Tax=Aeromonas sp. RU39B TaxID=1907416 RepID=UPI0009552922|nr:high-affinity branched-chain amino acid ABC transporter permease LivM [Aeromonas sp. RU39B]SIR26734.1 L-leucine ABC transporter membrane protein /L-isoleucine ABC transporter membrane protein /L-valine ABC transporter membrane protein [Aeromonas sp. RU39B]
MKNFKQAIVAALVTVVLGFWLFCYQLQMEGVGLTVASRLQENGPMLALGAIVVFLFQLFRTPIAAGVGSVRSALPSFSLPTAQSNPGLHRLGQLVLLVAVVAFAFMASRNVLDLATLVMIYVMLGLGLNIQVGLAGLLDLGYVGFYAIGAYTYALLNQAFGLGFWQCLPIAGGIAALAGFLLGFPVLRLRGDYLAIVTLGFGEIIRILLNNLTTVTGGPNGISGIPKPTLFGLEFSRRPEADGGQTFHQFFGISYDANYKVIFLYLMAVLLVVFTLLVIKRLLNMPLGRAWEALREDEIACRSLGLNPTIIKLSAFAIGAAFAGFAGSFFAARQGFISPESFTFIESAIILAIVVLGGMGSLAGVVLAAIIMTVLPELRAFNEYRMLMFGLLMVLMMLWRPQGLIPMTRQHVELPK